MCKMKDYQCKCEGLDFEVIPKDTRKGLYCTKCGRWFKWLGKDEFNLFQMNKIFTILDLKEEINDRKTSKFYYDRW